MAAIGNSQSMSRPRRPNGRSTHTPTVTSAITRHSQRHRPTASLTISYGPRRHDYRSRRRL
ncbi:hypothetical protein BIW11_08647 [Tropilaelaps mercedesae]|uniref:Uncharacterized protein n=1 Tax=Tropilaelaps mercedesae TaxID=418985 RepID=A0A1V9XNP1_9ACAR|nr:hypothetical protein BIW11_08647 [Tropilaelaps mercedesae]